MLPSLRIPRFSTLPLAWAALSLFAGVTTASAVTLEQIVSHEDPAFDAAAARLSIGRDGVVYLHQHRSTVNSGYLLRMNPDGGQKSGTRIHYAAHGVAANASGQYIVAEAHFAHSATIYGKNFARINSVIDFNGTGYDAPQHVEVGASNDFYAGDARGHRILRINARGEVVAKIYVEAVEFRVSEKNDAVYVAAGNKITCVGTDGTKMWSVPAAGVGSDTYTANGGFDVDDDGNLYVIESQGNRVRVYGPDGVAGDPIDPHWREGNGDGAPTLNQPIEDLRVWKGDLFIKRAAPIELFRRYDLATGAFKGAVSMDYERFGVKYASQTWSAGQKIPFDIGFMNAAGKPAPLFRVWAAPFGTARYREFVLADGQLEIPSDAGGLYGIKITPETSPWQRRAPSDYLVHDVVEIRQPGSQGTANVLTPENRVYYARGEAIPLSLIVRAAPGAAPPKIQLQLVSTAEATKPLLKIEVTTPEGTKPFTTIIAAATTAALRPGNYWVTAMAPGLTIVPQAITLGAGFDGSNYQRIQFGDYGTDMGFDLTTWDAADVSSFYADRTARLGINLVSQRAMGSPWAQASLLAINDLAKRLGSDPFGVAPEKARLASPFFQTLAAWGARGVQAMPLLLTNDASMVLGVGFDRRAPEKLVADIQSQTTAMLPYAAFRGWDWAANWWNTGGAENATSPEQKKAFQVAQQKAKESGAWDPVLDEVTDTMFARPADDTKLFGDALKQVAPGKVTAVAAPYRHVYAYPPVQFRNVDEVDLHLQAEQMTWPYFAPHDVDFYRRPSKPAWGHPEIWNDSGTGDQILPTLFQMAMRGSNGIGFSGSPGWTAVDEKGQNDARLPFNGTMSVFRATFNLFKQYGPWLNATRTDDQVAIVADGRMLRMDDWPSQWGTHFARIYEAYAACLHAHHPASIVFVDDMKPDTLAHYKAVLLVGQRIEMEDQLVVALAGAKAAGTAILYDETCRESLVQGYIPLGIGFDHIEHDPWTWGDDAAFSPGRFPSYVLGAVSALKAKLDPLTAPVADIANPEVLLTQRAAGAGRFLFVTNNTTPQLDPGQMWRQSLFVSTRVPLETPVGLNATGKTIYDLFALRQVTPQAGSITADLRSLPLRIYAILPAPIAGVALRAPRTMAPGRSLTWGAWVRDAAGTAIDSSLPVRIRVLDDGGAVLEEKFVVAVANAGATGNWTVPLNASGPLTLEATELCSGKSALFKINLSAAALPLALDVSLPADAMVAGATGLLASTPGPAGNISAMDTNFGPHVRDVALSADGSLALCNAMNWNENLYGVDTATGAVRWRKRAGQSFAYAPQSLGGGFAVQGFDFNSVEGYHLYLAGADGQLERRFALYGLSRRLPMRFLVDVNDRLNNFAAARDGSWVGASGDLGIAVWSRAGKLLWQQDSWKTTHNHARFAGMNNWPAAFLAPPIIMALDTATLLIVDGVQATAREATTGKELWHLALATDGTVTSAISSADGKTQALMASTAGGRIFVLRGGKLMASIPATGHDFCLSPDGNHLAVVSSTQLQLFTVGSGLTWTFNGDEVLQNPRVAADGRVACSSRMGTLYVLSPGGQSLFQRDMGALTVPTWLPDGDLLLATWMGTVTRLDATYKARWNTLLAPGEADMRGKILESDGVPTTRVAVWGNAAAQTSPLTPNLLSQAGAKVTLNWNGKPRDLPVALSDGKPDASAEPLVTWGEINWLGEGSQQNWIELALPRTAGVSGVTLAEDAAHPESWLRDAYVEYYDETQKDWVFVQPLLSNSALHSHIFAQPVHASRLRIMLTPGLVGNLRLGEIVLHGAAP